MKDYILKIIFAHTRAMVVPEVYYLDHVENCDVV